jgi:membrane protein HdeD
MQKLGSAIVLIVLGLIVMAFPLLGVVPAALITGFVVLIFGLGLVLTGISEMEESMAVGLTEVILGIIALVMGIGLVANPELFAIIAGLMVYIVGLILVVSGIVVVLTKDDGRMNGIVAIIIGLVYIIVGNFASNPLYLGFLIGLWLLIMGLIMLFNSD